MAFQALSVGDLVMIAQAAWRIGRAFKSAPAEFAQVERELSALGDVLSLADRTLRADGSILSQANAETVRSIQSIFASAGRSLKDLEGVLEKYEIIRKPDNHAGICIERPWSTLMLANYRTLRWTTECSNIQQLQDMLRVHTNSINLTMQALQTGSLGRLEKTVVPMAENIAGMHALLNGDLGQKIDDVHRFIMAVANGTPSLRAKGDSVDYGGYRGQSFSSSLRSSPFLLESPTIEPSLWNLQSPSYARARCDSVLGSASPSDSYKMPLSSSPHSDGAAQIFRHHERDGSISSLPNFEIACSPLYPHVQTHRFHLPAPAIPELAGDTISPVTPQILLTTPLSRAPNDPECRPPSGLEYDQSHSRRSFEHQLFQDATILSDSKVVLVEYTRCNLHSSDTRYETEMVSLCKEARVCVIRKPENREHGGTTMFTSIWTLSNDGTIRCQQKLANNTETVPHCSFFELQKVSIAAPGDSELTMRCHGAEWADGTRKDIKTTWVNYVFAAASDASKFQSAVFGRALLGSFRTSKTTVLHGGVRGVFTFEEQFAKLNRLRLWQDNDNKGVLALMHVSSSFGDGWVKFWLNNSRQQVWIKKDGERCVRLKGLDIAVPGSIPVTAGPARRPSMLEEHLLRAETTRSPTRRVSGLRVEFETVQERDEFLALSRRVQESMLPLPRI